jgi:hypothetical protein
MTAGIALGSVLSGVLLETGAEFGGALGMAFLGAIGTAVCRRGIPSSAPDAAHETLGGALVAAGQLPGRAGDALATAAREAFTDGMRAAAIAGAVLLAGAAVAAATLRRIPHPGTGWCWVRTAKRRTGRPSRPVRRVRAGPVQGRGGGPGAAAPGRRSPQTKVTERLRRG